MHRLVMLLLILALVGSTVAPFLSVKGNPLYIEAPAPANSNPIIKITSPKENATYTNGTINVCFTVIGSKDPSFVVMSLNGWYKGDWMNNSKIADGMVGEYNSRIPIFLQYNFDVTGIPFGEHSLLITASGSADFIKNNSPIPKYLCSLSSTLCVNFSVRNNPIITFPSSQNCTVTDSSFPLNFTVDHSVTEMAYSLDKQESVPISGNTTLTDLPNGEHNVTVYAADAFGNTGTSDTLFFSVKPPEFPVMPVVAAFVTVVVLIAAGLLVYNKKRKRSWAK
jgi:hypothetical protein